MNEKKKAKKRGRPPLPKGQVKGKIVPMRLMADEVRLFTKAAKAEKCASLSEWMRQVLRKAANR